MAPRPILKRSPTTATTTHAVHFPPSPSLTNTFAAYSPSAYDRSPIVVKSNVCNLPKHGCPGRTYPLIDSPPPSPTPSARVSFARNYHPRALSRTPNCSPRSSNLALSVPPLIPDLSSESDESDAFAPTPAEQSSNSNFGLFGLAGPSHHLLPGCSSSIPDAQDSHNHTSASYVPCDSPPFVGSALSFLPYSPTASPSLSPYLYEDTDDLPAQKPRRRPSPTRRHESSRNQDRIRTDLSSAFASISLASSPSSPPTTPTKRSSSSRSSSSRRSPTASSSFASPLFNKEQDECLDGF